MSGADYSTGDESIKSKKNKFFWWVVGFIVWTGIGLSFAFRTYITYYFDGKNPSWLELSTSSLTDFYLWGLASPFIFYLCRRFPIERENAVLRIFFFFAVGVGLTFLILTLAIVFYWYVGSFNKSRWPSLGIMFSNLVTNLYLIHQFTLIYWVTVVIGQAFEYYRQLRVGKMRAAELSIQLAQAQLAALKMQVHPHFLFNTLNSIAALLHKDVEAADRMIARLSDFLRMTLRSPNEPIISLAQELEFLTTYLEIEKVRFQERLSIEIDVDPATLDARVPNLILQPLVENAVRHGLARQKSVGRLSVRARRTGNRLEILIKDNGRGLRNNGNSERGNANGLGLDNTRARLDQVYEGDFSFEITDNSGESGATARLSVPYFV